MDCPFCDPQIIKKQLLLKTTSEFVLYNIRKTTKGRCLVIPKRHVQTIRDLPKLELQSLIQTVQLVSKRLFSYLHPTGLNYGFNEGWNAGQEIEHFHFHILPRYDDDILPEFHIFHHDPKMRQNYSDKDFVKLVREFKNIFKKY